MKQYTNESQTAKLIELGFEKPKSISGYYQRGPYEYDAETNTKMVVYDDTQYPIYAYSIGELLSLLPQSMNFDDGAWPLSIEADPFKVNGTWWVFYEPSHHTESAELINAIFDMVVKLKEEGVI